LRFQALTEHQLLVFWAQLLVLVLAARGLGALARRWGQPAVVGELAAGVLLGPSVLGALAPGLWAWLFPPDPVHAGLMAGVGWLGVFFLLVLAGYETDLGLVRRLGRAAAYVSCGSLVVPLLFGIGVGLAMPAAFVGAVGDRTIFTLFMATALAISALPVLAKVLADLDLLRRDFGQLSLAAGMANDVVGWVLLGVIAGMAQSGTVELRHVALALGGLAVLVVVVFTAGQRAVDALLMGARRREAGVAAALTIVVVAALAGAVAAQAIGLEGVLGAFLVGVMLGRTRLREREAFAVLESLTVGFLAPIFFARAGLRVDLFALADPEILLWAVAVLAAASASKILGALGGAVLAGRTAREGLALGAGLNARGALEIVVASVGLTVGVLNQASYTVIVLMAIATSMMAPIMLRAIVRDWRGSPAERARLDRERVLGRNTLVRPVRLLLPTRGGANSEQAARLLDLAWPEEAEATVLSVGGNAASADVARVCAAFATRRVEHAHVESDDPLAAILTQARLGYGAIGVGATDEAGAGRLISPVVDALLAASPLPVIMVRRGPSGVPAGAGRILVPAIGTVAGRAALEVAYSVARRTGGAVTAVHVVPAPATGLRSALLPWRRAGRAAVVDEGRAAVAAGLLEEARGLAAEMGIEVATRVHGAPSASEGLLALAREIGASLLVVTASVRQLSHRPFLGHGVERLLADRECTLVVVATPPGWERR
jgi:Kef-type K+ transport system membrane component KefB/nucleotide-binding universal stress UspA family protein